MFCLCFGSQQGHQQGVTKKKGSRACMGAMPAPPESSSSSSNEEVEVDEEAEAEAMAAAAKAAAKKVPAGMVDLSTESSDLRARGILSGVGARKSPGGKPKAGKV